MTNQYFPVKSNEPTTQMVISLSGVLDRAAEACKRSRNNKQLHWPLLELLKHVEHLRESESDEQALERLSVFLKLWVPS